MWGGRMENCESLTEAAVLGLGRLQSGYNFAVDVDEEPEQFSLEIEQLTEIGVGYSELRWMIAKGLVHHLIEMTLDGDECRHFRCVASGRLCSKSCFLITEHGRSLLALADPAAVSAGIDTTSPESHPTDRPIWDPDRQELSLLGHLIKRFRLPSHNQIAVLATFEEESWPVKVYDPLPVTAGIDPRRRLQDTIKGLNRSQKNPLLQFQGDGSGEGIVWEIRISELQKLGDSLSNQSPPNAAPKRTG